MKLFSFFIVILTALNGFATPLSITSQWCEYRENPIGVDTLEPRLSWMIDSKERGTLQSAYQVLVASNAENLKSNRGDLWDSGRVSSDNSTQVVYGGKPLEFGRICFWKVRVWNQKGQVSRWSKPATWTMGMLEPGDWQAKWIGFASTNTLQRQSAVDRLLVLEDCFWVWANGAVAGDQPKGRVCFRKSIEIPAGATVSEAKFLLAADDTLQLFVNGQSVGGKHRTWKHPAVRDLIRALKPGTNVLAIEVDNGSKSSAGLIGKLVVEFSNGETLAMPIDRSWSSSKTPGVNWRESLNDNGDWKPAAQTVPYGGQPWGRIERQIMKPAPFFRKPFVVAKPVKRATVFASALGVYELHLNGAPVDTDVLSPGWTDFSKRVHYRGYDVTKKLKRGDNVMGAILGDGWYASYIGTTGVRNYYGGDPRLLVQLNIEYDDGTQEIVGTDDSWSAAEGPIREADIQMGCVYDARQQFPGWDNNGFAAKWQSAQVDTSVKANLVAHPGEPMRRTEELVAQKVSQPAPGIYVFDLGQNMVGWARVKLKGRAGQKVVVRHAEMLNPDGTIYITNLRAAAATDTYVLAGEGKRAYEPYFTFHGFRYVEIAGLDYKPEASDVSGEVVHSDLPRAGWFECSEPLVNKLWLNSVWGQRGNFLDVPTDCPQRDERMGWTGDAQVFMKTACINLNSPAFYTKWLCDLCADSQREDGGFGDVAPHLDCAKYGNTGWTDAGPICAWRMFEMYGDTRVLSEYYPALQHHMEYLAKTSKGYMRGTGSYGDWLRLAGPQHSDVIGTAYYNYTAQVMAKIAEALGKESDAAGYRKLEENIRQAFRSNFIKPDGRIVDAKNETGQTFYALAFGLDLVPAEMKGKAAEQFVASLAEQNDHIATGFLGTPFILLALQKAGHSELAYKLVLNRTYPGWLQQVIWGSTTMWERWDGWRPDKGFQDAGMNSFNHYWLGCVNEWLFTQAAGVDTDGPGFRHIVIRPEVDWSGQGLHWVKARYDSIRGPIMSSWKVEDGRFHLKVAVPVNSTATVYVPAQEVEDVSADGRPIAQEKDIKFLRVENGRAAFLVGSGRYEFASTFMH